MTAPRIAILGAIGAGKTTLAGRLSERLRIPVIALDEHLLEDGKLISKAQQKRRAKALLGGESWIVEGVGWSAAQTIAANATVIVIFDPPLRKTLPRVVRRALKGSWQGWNARSAARLLKLANSVLWACYYPLVERRRVLRAVPVAPDDARVFVVDGIAEAERLVIHAAG